MMNVNADFMAPAATKCGQALNFKFNFFGEWHSDIMITHTLYFPDVFVKYVFEIFRVVVAIDGLDAIGAGAGTFRTGQGDERKVTFAAAPACGIMDVGQLSLVPERAASTKSSNF